MRHGLYILKYGRIYKRGSLLFHRLPISSTISFSLCWRENQKKSPAAHTKIFTGEKKRWWQQSRCLYIREKKKNEIKENNDTDRMKTATDVNEVMNAPGYLCVLLLFSIGNSRQETVDWRRLKCPQLGVGIWRRVNHVTDVQVVHHLMGEKTGKR